MHPAFTHPFDPGLPGICGFRVDGKGFSKHMTAMAGRGREAVNAHDEIDMLLGRADCDELKAGAGLSFAATTAQTSSPWDVCVRVTAASSENAGGLSQTVGKLSPVDARKAEPRACHASPPTLN